MDRLRQVIADGWHGREAVEYTAWMERIDAIIVPLLDCDTDCLPGNYDFSASFRSGITASDMADRIIESVWSLS